MAITQQVFHLQVAAELRLGRGPLGGLSSALPTHRLVSIQSLTTPTGLIVAKTSFNSLSIPYPDKVIRGGYSYVVSKYYELQRPQ